MSVTRYHMIKLAVIYFTLRCDSKVLQGLSIPNLDILVE